jgi:hypothetical protein
VEIPIRIGLRRSRLLSWLLVVLHVLAAGSLFLTPWPAVVSYSLLPPVVLSAWRTLQPSTIVGLRLVRTVNSGFSPQMVICGRLRCSQTRQFFPG